MSLRARAFGTRHRVRRPIIQLLFEREVFQKNGFLPTSPMKLLAVIAIEAKNINKLFSLRWVSQGVSEWQINIAARLTAQLRIRGAQSAPSHLDFRVLE